MDPQPIVVIGASQGGLGALRALAAALPEDFPAPVFIVLHIGAHDSSLAQILDRSGPLAAAEAVDGEPVRPGRIYVAAPDRHMIVADGAVRLTKGPRENFARPAIDPLFRSAAEAYGPAAIGVVLTGGLNDGTAGLYEIARRGGVTIVQDPDDADNPSMPLSALAHVAVDHCTPLALLPRLLQRVVAERAAIIPLAPRNASEGLEKDMTAEYSLDQPVAVTCPDCGGALRQGKLGTLSQFRCHIGHVYTAEAMLAGQFRAMEQAIEAALRSLNERAELCLQMADGADADDAAQWRQAMKDARGQAEPLLALLDHEWSHPATAGEPVRKALSADETPTSSNAATH